MCSFTCLQTCTISMFQNPMARYKLIQVISGCYINLDQNAYLGSAIRVLTAAILILKDSITE